MPVDVAVIVCTDCIVYDRETTGNRCEGAYALMMNRVHKPLTEIIWVQSDMDKGRTSDSIQYPSRPKIAQTHRPPEQFLPTAHCRQLNPTATQVILGHHKFHSADCHSGH